MRTFPDAIRSAVSAGISALVDRRVLNCLWEITYRCTARCAICGYWRNPSDPNEEMKLADIQEGLKRIHNYGCRVVNFTGGEPTIRRDLEDIVNYASRLGIWTSMVTNGSLLSRERMQELKDAGLDNLFVSLDSTNSSLHDMQRGIKGSYARVLDCMQWLSEDFLTGHRTGGIMCVLSNSNIHEADKIVKLADGLGVYVVFQPYHEVKTGNAEFSAQISKEVVDDILSLKKKHKNVLCSDSYLRGFPRFYQAGFQPRCYAAHKYFSIDPYGFLHPCVEMPIAGHVLKDDISVVRSIDALKNVNSCRGCWYMFRGEADSALSYTGFLERLRLGFTVIMRNERCRRAKRQISEGTQR